MTSPTVPGYEGVVAWFGGWPSFHDSEVLSIRIERDGLSSLRIRNWTTTERVEPSGQFVREREAVVVFEFRGIRSIRLEGEDADGQNVLGALLVELTDAGYVIDLSPSYGLSGRIVTRELGVRVEH